MKRITEEQLWDYADGLLSADEAKEIHSLIAADPSLQKKLEEIKAISKSLAEMTLETPSVDFTSKVISAWKTELASPKPAALKTIVNKKIIYGVAGLFVVSILALLAYTVAATVNVPASGIYDLSKYSSSLPKVNADVIFSNKLFYQLFFLLDVVLLLIFVDKYLRVKKLKKQYA
ncbi:anti-sigma factor family protein [Solitalea koreensis]|uniref:Zinc-finger n=1 Tax=Solitalea koreensis TaxID=543615 RepID=A0A521BZA0_9SPHI|nr:hypothetical protein [Solitalea koreensis]SMO51790.1 hypothetical protein SAMN06265350_1032 [Solitalea koreensis]